MIINKKAEVSPTMLIVIVVVVGLVLFLGARWIMKSNDIQTPNLNVTKLNDTVTSTAQQFVNKAGSVNVTDGKDLTLKNPISNISINSTNKTLIKVIYPNRTLTPGAIMSSNITQICTSGYSASVRDVSQATKDAVYIEYKLSPEQPTGAFEIDHLISLETGGSNDITNLWPQPAEPLPGYHQKDTLENYLHKQVCDGKMSLKEAQSIQANNWAQGYIDMKVNLGQIK